MRTMSSRGQNVRRFLPVALTVLSVVAIVVSVSVLFGPGALFDPPPREGRSDPLLPDLVMAPVTDVMPGYDEGAPLLHFSAIVANVGAGDFLVAARRSAPWTDDWAVSQRVQEAGGGYTERLTPAGMVFGGDRHNHWHVEGLESHRLERVDSGAVVGQVLKQGYCAFDTDPTRLDLPRAPQASHYLDSGCGGPLAISLRLGISVGWGDNYTWDFIEQKIDLTGLPAGRYRIVQVADPHDWFQELDETNNESSVEIAFEMSGIIPRITVVEPSEPP